MATVISVALQKGGVGKSTTAQALADVLGYKSKRVLLIDMDSQSNVTYSSGIDSPQYTITDVLGGDATAEETVIECKYYDLLPADSYLTNVEMANIEPTLLKSAIEPIKDSYDYIIIDTPPALGNLLFNSLMASDYVIIPSDPRPYAMQGLGALYNTIESVRSVNKSLKILGILLVKYQSRSILNRDIRDMIKGYAEQIGTVVFDTTIRESVTVPEAQILRRPLIEYSKNCNPSVDYINLTNEILEKIGDK